VLVALAFAAGALALAHVLSGASKAARPHVDEALLALSSPVPADGRDHVRLTWTGVAGVRLEATLAPTAEAPGVPLGPPEVTTLLVDPYVTRHAAAELAFPLDVDEAGALAAFPRADAIFVGHSHHDHLSDAIFLAKSLGAALFGSSTSCALALAQGLPPERCRLVADRQRFLVGPVEVEVVAHAHGRTPLGVPFDGEVPAPAPARPFAWQMKMGGAFAYVFRVAGRTVYHQGTAGLTDAQLARIHGLRPDLALVGVALRGREPDFEARLLGALQPRRVAAIHHDDFLGGRLTLPFEPADVDLRGFERAVAAALGAESIERLAPFRPVEVDAAGAH
jgi:L-ascorbate metabolism protein UlaG (beta-lactamase superfamily)